MNIVIHLYNYDNPYCVYELGGLPSFIGRIDNDYHINWHIHKSIFVLQMATLVYPSKREEILQDFSKKFFPYVPLKEMERLLNIEQYFSYPDIDLTAYKDLYKTILHDFKKDINLLKCFLFNHDSFIDFHGSSEKYNKIDDLKKTAAIYHQLAGQPVVVKYPFNRLFPIEDI